MCLAACSATHQNISLAEATTVILCGCLPIAPRFFQLFHSRSKSNGSSRQPFNGRGSLTRSWSKRINLPSISINKTRAARRDTNDPDLYLDGQYVPLVEQGSFKSSAKHVPREVVDLEMNDGIRKTTCIETKTQPGFKAPVEAILTAGPLM